MINVCFQCGSRTLRRSKKPQSFEYNDKGSVVQLRADVDVIECTACGFQMTDEQAEIARQEAVCAYHNVMSPSQVRAVRETSGMSRSEYARVTRIGEASLIRWETGSHVPNGGYDSFLYLLGFSENVERLKRRTPGQSSVEREAERSEQVIQMSAFRGRALANNDVVAKHRSEQKDFLLRRTG